MSMVVSMSVDYLLLMLNTLFQMVSPVTGCKTPPLQTNAVGRLPHVRRSSLAQSTWRQRTFPLSPHKYVMHGNAEDGIGTSGTIRGPTQQCHLFFIILFNANRYYVALKMTTE
jgi:hypothetical protein